MSGDGDARDGNESARFEEIDWSTTDRTGLAAIPRKYLYAGFTYLLLGAALCYDYVAVPAREPTVGALGWDVSGVDWLFLGALVALFWFALVPLAANPRLTRYYWTEFRKNRAAVVGLAYLAGIFALGILGPLVLEPPSIALARKYQPPVYSSIDAVYPIRCLGETVGAAGDQRCLGTWAHPLGTNSRGKDILTIVVYGMGVSAKIGLVAAAMIVAIGTAVGTTAAYVGGLVDELLMRYVDDNIDAETPSNSNTIDETPYTIESNPLTLLKPINPQFNTTALNNNFVERNWYSKRTPNRFTVKYSISTHIHLDNIIFCPHRNAKEKLV